MKIAHIKDNEVKQIWAAGDSLADIRKQLPDIANEVEEVPDTVCCHMIKSQDGSFINPPPRTKSVKEVRIENINAVLDGDDKMELLLAVAQWVNQQDNKAIPLDLKKKIQEALK